jgi:hypothetical protein
MKPLYVLIAALVLVAGCGDSDTAPADDNRPQFTAALLAANETPVTVTGPESAATGSAVIHLNLTRDAAGAITAATADFQVELSGFPSTTVITAAHIHPGAAGTSGGVLVNTGISQGQVPLTNGVGTFTANGISVTAANAQAIINNPAGYYFNVHSQAYTGGVVRGQLVRN